MLCSIKELLNKRPFSKLILFSLLMAQAQLVLALPVDWHGFFGLNTTRISHYKKTKGSLQTFNDGSQAIGGSDKTAAFHNYILKLQPSIIINDSATFFGEISTGYNKGGFLGDNSTSRGGNAPNNFGDALYFQNTSTGNSNIVASQFYLKLYADTATYTLGRHPLHWGLGAVFNNGESNGDHFSSIRDGATIDFKVGNFSISPYYGVINSLGSLSYSTNSKEFGISVLYEVVERDIALGMIYGKRTTEHGNSQIKGNAHSGTTDVNITDTDVKIIDLFLKKSFGDFKFAVEIPFFDGNIGNAYNKGNNVDYKSYAVVTDSSYALTSNWQIGTNIGYVKGATGTDDSYQAMYLNPNYQIAYLLFKYNLRAVDNRSNNRDDSQSLYDSYINNTFYASLYTKYQTGPWGFEGAFIYAKANEVAKARQAFFNHSTNKFIAAGDNLSDVDQSRDLGWEIDLGANYSWNSNINLYGKFGYHVVGDYYKYTNNNESLTKANSYVLLFGVDAAF